MTEIEKMFENAGIAKIGIKKCTTSEYLDCQNYCFISENNKCDKFSYQYPPFTAEKQLELIKWLCQKTYRNYLLIRYDFTNYYWQIECNMTDSNKLDSFSEAIASIVNHLWQDLTDQEKEEIRNILNA